MQRANFLDELGAKLSALLSTSPVQDVERNVQALVRAALSRLDLVTREEFDVQAKLLARAREQLTALEARVAELERRQNAGRD